MAEGEAVVVCVADDSFGEGVIGELFDAGSDFEEFELAARGIGEGYDGNHFEGAGGKGAGFVEDDCADFAAGLECGGLGEEDAHASGAAECDGDGGGGGETHGAGAGDDDGGDGGEEGGLPPPPVMAGDHPEGEVEEAEGEDDGDEDTGDAVGEFLDAGFAGLSGVDEFEDSGDGGGGGGGGGADDDAAVGEGGAAGKDVES